MKKRNLLLALMMAFVMLCTACGTEEKTNPFVGKWNGTVDYTDYFVQSMVAENASLKEYAKFENLTLNYVFEFTEDTVSLSLDEASTKQFITNVETGVANMVDAMAADLAAENDVTAEDIYAGMAVTRDAYVQSVIDSMKIDAMLSTMSEALKLSGSYEYDEETITVSYKDNTYEGMKYAFDKGDLTITVSDGTNEFTIYCEKAE